jgi:histidine triad (HIT) family protein
MSDCIFCKIVAGEIPAAKVYSDEQVTAFRDIHPVAPVHVLIIPNKHIPSLNEIEDADQTTLGTLLLAVKKIAAQEGIAEGGYRLIVNTGKAAHQEVLHIHLHLIGGAPLKHPMG